MKFWQVTLETRNFSFEAYGVRKSDALTAMCELMRKHAEQYALPETWADFEDVNFREFKMDCGYRDGKLVP